MEDYMTNYKYREIKKTESLLNDRLLNFIIEKNEIDNIMGDFDINKPPLSNWITSDYIKLDGNTYIDEFIELHSNSLDSLEVEILNQKSTSHISMFEIIEFIDNKIYIEDKFNNIFYTIIDDSIRGVLLGGDYILARVANVSGHHIFIGDVEYIPSSIVSQFYEGVFIYFNRERIDKPNLEINNYLKRYSLDVYTLYRECLADHMDEAEDEVPPIIADIAEFQEYAMDYYPKDYHIYMTNLMEIFEYGLMEKDLSLQDINKIDIEKFFTEAIEDGFINSKEDYNSYLDTLKAYLIFLGPANPEYKATYNRVAEISKNRFKYMNSLKNNNFNYNYDRMLVSTITNRLSTDALTLVGDLDRFLIFVMEFEIGLTPKKKDIQKKELLSISKLLKLSSPFLNSRPNQKDSRIIDLLYHLTLNLDLTKITDSRMVITEKGKNFFKLRDEEKFAIAFSYIWSKDFIKGIGLENEVIERFLDLEYHSLDELIRDITDSRNKKVILASGFVRYLILIGVAKFNNDFDISFTSLGRLIYKYMLSIKDKKTRVISFEDYKEQKTKEV